MTEQTLYLLDQPKKASSKAEALRLVTRKQLALKHSFEAKGIPINSENSRNAQGFQHSQPIRDRDRNVCKAYIKINFTRHRLTADWYDRLNDQAKFYSLQQSVEAQPSSLPRT